MTTIYDALAERLGRKPTHQEIKDEVKRILADSPIGRSRQSKRLASLTYTAAINRVTANNC